MKPEREPADTEELRRRPNRRAYATIALVGAAIAGATVWCVHVPVASDLPISDSWEVLQKDWYTGVFSRSGYYRYRARGSPEELSTWIRARLDEAGPWFRSRDVTQSELMVELKDRDRSADQEMLQEAAQAESMCIYFRDCALENPGRFILTVRRQEFDDSSEFRIVHVRVSEDQAGISIVEIWDAHRLNL